MATDMIVIGGREPDEGMLAEDLNQAEDADEMEFEALSPEGSFTPKTLNALVKATNKLLPAFGQTPDYPTFSEDISKFPTDFTRILAMFAEASADAAEADAIDGEMVVDIGNITDDRSIIVEAGRIDMLSKSKDFKRFLKEPSPETEEEAEEAPEDPVGDMDEASMDAMFMDRM